MSYTVNMASLGYEEIEHPADWALRVRGADMAELLANAAAGMLRLSGAKPLDQEGDIRPIRLKAPDRETLLVMWLEELLFLMETRGVAFRNIQIRSVRGASLEACVVEAPLEAIIKQIKAVTFSDLRIAETTEGLEATVVFDV